MPQEHVANWFLWQTKNKYLSGYPCIKSYAFSVPQYVVQYPMILFVKALINTDTIRPFSHCLFYLRSLSAIFQSYHNSVRI